jgi:ligand-binding sensor domain-containing protein
VAIYGDGLWSFDGARWERAFGNLPAAAREVTALAVDGKGGLWVGTRRAGLFRCQDGNWTAFSQPDEPVSHNVQNMIEFQGVLWASTLDDGLVCRSGEGWKQFTTPILSSSAPRQMTVWKDRLYVRHGGGLADSFDGRVWTKNDLADVPRKGIYALASDDSRLYAAGWGGWSEWDGQSWTPHFEVAPLKGVPVLGLLPDGDNLWFATQSRGLGRWNRASGEFRWFDERDGLSDDWVTALAKIDGHIYAGTFVGGVARLDGDKWKVFEELKGLNVTAIEAGEQGSVRASTRHGLWRISGDKAEKVGEPWLDSEQQALLATKDGLWIGTRTSLNYWRQS